MTENTYMEPLLPPFLYPSRDKTQQAWMSRLVKERRIRSVGPRLYTSLPEAKVKTALRGSWGDVVSNLFPQALLSYRSAIEYRPTPEGDLYLTANTNRIVRYPGLNLHFIRGPEPLKEDTVFLRFRASSFPRALLENLSSTKASAQRTLPVEELEQRLETILQIEGEKELNSVRDHARKIARELKWEREFKKLDEIVGALLGTRSTKNLKTPVARARAIGRPFDSAAIEKFDLLLAELMNTPYPEVKDPFRSHDHIRNKAFFEAYFSNYIEGTIFEIEEAEEILFRKKIPASRPKDSHDILGTFQIVSDPNEMRQIPNSFENFEQILKRRHQILMSARPEAGPGEFKIKPNRAGSTHFTDPALVVGTLEKGFERYTNLPQGLPRAVFMMFLITEVHPFTDGNGRIARIMMNAELWAKALSTVIIPTVTREDYVLALRALSRMNRPTPLAKLISKAQRAAALDFTKYPFILRYLENHNWFREPDEAKLVE